MPRLGEYIHGYGKVIENSHLPTGLPDQLPQAAVTLFTTGGDPFEERA